MYLESGKDIKFSCTALGGSATTISWTLNGKDYTSGIVGTPVWDEGTHSITSEISITGVDADDDGLYVCRHSGDPSVTDSITLDVYGKFVNILFVFVFNSYFRCHILDPHVIGNKTRNLTLTFVEVQDKPALWPAPCIVVL